MPSDLRSGDILNHGDYGDGQGGNYAAQRVRRAIDIRRVMATSSTNESRETALPLAEHAEQEAAEAEAAAAQARAAELHAQDDEAEVPESDDAEVVDEAPKGRFEISLWHVVGAAVALCALLAANAYLIWSGHTASQQHAHRAEFAAAARQGVINLMSLDFDNSDADLQRLIDSTTGDFRADFEKRRNDFATVLKESKVVAEANVRITAVEKMTDDSATVLVAATSQVSNSTGAQQQPRAWRLSIDVTRDNGQIKMSKVEFVP